MPVTPLFNPEGDDRTENRQIWFGNTTNLMQLNDVKYTWAVGLYQQMRENFWIPFRLDVTQDVTDYNNLTNSERRAYDGILSYLTFLDSVQTRNVPHITNSVTAPEISLCMGEQISQECFDDLTEILTDSGWVLFSQLKESDLVAQYDLQSQSISFISPSRYVVKDYEGDMVFFESQHTSICVTPNHELINIHPVTKVATKRLAKDTKGGNYSYPKTGSFTAGCINQLTTLTKLLIAVAADGTIRVFDKTAKVTSNVQMSLLKARKIERLEQYLDELGIAFTKTFKDGKIWVFSFTLPVVVEQDKVKSLSFVNPFLATKEVALDLLKEFVFWDGSQERCFYSTNKKAVDTVQLVAMVAGKNASVGVNRSQEQASQTILPQGGTAIAAKTCYVLTISDSTTKTYPDPHNIFYSGKVYCVTVPEGNIVTRRNGKLAVTGNCMHNHSYQYLIESIIPPERRTAVYEFWRTDKVLKQRCEFIAGMYQKYVDDPTHENYFVALMADFLLEGLYFYNGFISFYNLGSRMLMPGSADVFKMINRDELSHVRLYQKLIPEAMKVFPHSLEQIYEMFNTAVDYECLWTNHIVGTDVLGITEDSTEQYTKYLANMRLRSIGLDPLYTDDKFTKSPYTHLERFSDTKKEGHTKANFFEATVTSYVMSSGISGWDEI